MSASRRFTDAFGFSWQVWELVASEETNAVVLADRRPARRGWLYFFSRGTTLVLRDYARDWVSLSWEELEVLRLRAQVLGSDTAVRVPESAPRFDERHAHRM